MFLANISLTNASRNPRVSLGEEGKTEAVFTNKHVCFGDVKSVSTGGKLKNCSHRVEGMTKEAISGQHLILIVISLGEYFEHE